MRGLSALIALLGALGAGSERPAPAVLRVAVQRDGGLRPARVELRPVGEPRAAAVSTVPANRRAPVAPGRYDLLIILDDAPSIQARLFDRTLVSRRETSLELAMRDGALAVQARDSFGSIAPIVRVTPRGGGRKVSGSGPTIWLPPGPYALTVEHPDGLDFPAERGTVWIEPGEQTVHRVRFETGRLKVDARPGPATVRVFRRGAAEPFNHFPSRERAVLTPGHYRLEIKDRAGRTASAAVEIRAGRVTRARLTLRAPPPARIESATPTEGPLPAGDAELYPEE